MDKKDAKQKEKAPLCCEGCIRWDAFGKACWVYWDNKKNCTMYVTAGEPIQQ